MSNTSTTFNKYQLASDIVLTTNDGKEYVLASPSNVRKDVEVMFIKIYESIDSPYLLAEMNITDIAINLVGSIPLQGMEKITFGMKTPYFSDETYNYDFRIYAIRNRYVNNKIQNYTLDLISYEGLRNEATRVGSTLIGTGDKIVKDILNNYLSATSKVSDTNFESCQYQMKFIPSNKRPFDVIASILPKCISSAASLSKTTGSKSSIPKSTTTPQASTSSTNTPSIDSGETISGSTGYCFWETQKGYMFKSIDKMCSSSGKFGGESPKGTFTYQMANVEGVDPGKNIIEYNYINEIDVMKKMRYGTYSSLMVFFNPSTGQYEEYVFDINKSYSSMAHLGKDEKIPEGPKQLAKYPTRIMSQIIDHETFYDGEDIASPDPKDGGKAGTQFPDFKKFYAAQSVSRSLLLGNQQLDITINGNLSLRAGDKITVLLPKFSVDSKKEDSKYDKQHSGTYLIKSISYEFHIKKGGQSNITISNLSLIRDSFGIFNLEV
jgi:hypothetical protein